MKFVYAVFYISLTLRTIVNSKCISASRPLGYVVEHAVWRGWHQVFIFSNALESGKYCHKTFISICMECIAGFSKNSQVLSWLGILAIKK